MKRIVISILGGIAFPILFFAGAGAICIAFPQWDLAGNERPGLIFTPIAIPIHIYISLDPQEKFLILGIIGMIAFNFIFYASLTYFLLWTFKMLKKKQFEDKLLPPPPPEF